MRHLVAGIRADTGRHCNLIGPGRAVAGATLGPILAFLLDFDGLILDTESCALTSWAEEYAHFGQSLSLGEWHAELGIDVDHEGSYTRLEQLVGPVRLSQRNSREQRQRRHVELIAQLDARPGVRRFVEGAVALGHPIAVVSSSPASWVKQHLNRLGLLTHIQVCATGDEVARRKPAPDLYQLALQRLCCHPGQAVAFEDSEPGLAAAHAAGLACIAVPNPVTADHDFSVASFVAASFEDVRIQQLLGRSWPTLLMSRSR